MLSESQTKVPKQKQILKSAPPSSRSNTIADRISAGLKLSPIVSKILVAREIDSIEEAKSFLNPTLRNDLPDPLSLKNAEKAAELIVKSIEAGDYITIFSDFDVDGISSASQLWILLKEAGAKLRYYVPNRMTEGYGLSSTAINKLHAEKTNLLITLDCGITNVKEVTLAKELGLKVIIVDHHEIGEKNPPADLIVNPMQKDCGFYGQKLCTAGIVWLLGILLIRKIKEQNPTLPNKFPSSKDLLDLAAIGTICDMVPLRGVNRLIASRGIDAIRQSPRIGIQAIQEVAQIPQGARFTCSSIAFGIGPRLNAAGRLEDANIGMSLLISDSPGDAKDIANKINSLNNQRKTHEEHAKSICADLAAELEEFLEEPPSAYTLYDESFHVGVIGIAAQRMVEQFSRPIAVLGKSDDSNVAKGSVRSIGGFHVSETLNALSHLLIKHGGHKEAGGFSILEEHIPTFKKEFNELAKTFFNSEEPKIQLKIDQEIAFKEINIKLVKELEQLAPFGVGNPSPLFYTSNVEIAHIQIIGTNHVKMELIHDGVTRNALGWRMLGHPLLEQGNFINLAYSLEINTYKGISSVQLILKEITSENPIDFNS